MMRNGRTAPTGTPIPRIENGPRLQSPVITRQMTDEEREKYCGKPKQAPDYSLAVIVGQPQNREGVNEMESPAITKEQYLELRRTGKTRTSIQRDEKINPGKFYQLLMQWGIKDPAVEEAELDKSGIVSAANEVAATIDATKEATTEPGTDISAPTEPNVSSCSQPVDKSVDKPERRERKVSVSIALSDAIMRAAVQDLIDEVHDTAVEMGWYENEVQLPVQLALIHSEVSEALEADRKKRGPEKVAEELADVVIRVMDTAAAHNLDLTAALFAKMELNRGREHRHGGLPY